jgi:hypothetical protein
MHKLATGAVLASSPMYFSITEAIADAKKNRAPGIQSSTGNVIVNGASARPEQWPSSAGEVLVETQNTQATTVLVGDDAFLLRSNSRIIIEQDDNFIIRRLRILTGKLLSVFGEKKRPLQASSTTATFGIRGTGAYIEAYPHLTYLCTCYGTISMASSANPDIEETVTTQHHESPRYILDESRGGAIVQAPVFNHSDAELIMLESLAGRPSPFTDSNYSY